MHAKPQIEHEWLQQLVGNWTFDTECLMGPDEPPYKASGKEVVRSLGGLWTIAEGEHSDPKGGDNHQSIMTLGYDPLCQKYVGTFTASMMTYLWVYQGTLNDSKTVLTLDTEGPHFSGTGLGKYQDLIEIVSPDHRVLRSQMLGEDGQWVPFMTGHYFRQK